MINYLQETDYITKEIDSTTRNVQINTKFTGKIMTYIFYPSSHNTVIKNMYLK